ncbi:Acb2/Tad1 domain-containing protein [Methylobacterium fujisawaense]
MTDKKHDGLPVSGYVSQTEDRVTLVNQNKALEEQVLRQLDKLAADNKIDGRWLAIGRTGIENAFMAINRAVFKPTRVELPGDK